MATETLRPNAAGDECAISGQYGAACPNHYQNVDEEVCDGTTTAVYEPGTNWRRDLYNVQDHSVGLGTINFVKVYACLCSAWSADTNCTIAIKSGGVVDEDTKSVTTSWTMYSTQWNTPPEGGSWDWDKIDALQIGCSLVTVGGNHTGMCSQLYVEVDYTPPAAAVRSHAYIFG